MSVSDLKAQLSDIPGIQGLTMTTVAGRDNYGFDGLLVSLDPTRGQDEVAAEIRRAFAVRVSHPYHFMPPVNFTTETPPGKPMAATGSFAASLRAIVDGAKANLEQVQAVAMANVVKAADKYNDVAAATVHVTGTMVKTMEDGANAALADLGQISNDLTGEA